MNRARPASPTSLFLTLRQAAELTGFAYALLYAAVKNGKLRVAIPDDGTRKHATIYVERASLDALINEWLVRA